MDDMTHQRKHWDLLLILLVTLVIIPTLPLDAHAQGPNRVGLVVRLSDGSHLTRCVEFSEPEINGYDVLIRSRLDVVAAGQAICDIEDQSDCPAADCFCQCHGVPCLYWSYWHLVGGDWDYSGVGAGAYQVHDGDVEGWSWGADEPLPVIAFHQICLPIAIYLPLVLRP
jgi:hypothetical protein